jgi:hypothetical protein
MSAGPNDTTMPAVAATVGGPKLRTVTVEARGESFKIVQLAGMLLVCAQQHGSCCCGWDEKGRMAFDTALWGDEWERRKIRNRLHLTLYATVGRTDIFYAVAGTGPPFLVPSLAGTPIYERTFTPALGSDLQLIFAELRSNRTTAGDTATLTLDGLVEDVDRLRQALGLSGWGDRP